MSPSRSIRSVGVLAPALLVLVSCVQTPSGRTQLELYSESVLESQAAALYDDMRTKQPVSRDTARTALVLCVANAITEALPAGYPKRWEVTLFEDETANAFALPGAKIGVHTGLLEVARTQDQLAAVIGHEVAHVLEHHANARASNQAIAAGLIGMGATAVGAASDMDPAEVELLGQVFGMGAQYGALLPFSRSHESIADSYGLLLMADAGFDPREAVALWQNMAAASQGEPIEWMSTHPSHGTRIDDLTKQMPKAMERHRRAQEAGRRPHCQ